MRNVPSVIRFCQRWNFNVWCRVSDWSLQLGQVNIILIQRIFVSFTFFFCSSESSSKFKIGCWQHWGNGHGRCWIIHFPVILCIMKNDKKEVINERNVHMKFTCLMLSDIDFELGQLPGCKSEWVSQFSHSNEKPKKNTVKKIVRCKKDHIFRYKVWHPIPKADDVIWNR